MIIFTRLRCMLVARALLFSFGFSFLLCCIKVRIGAVVERIPF
jgi:hypothetical protein